MSLIFRLPNIQLALIKCSKHRDYAYAKVESLLDENISYV